MEGLEADVHEGYAGIFVDKKIQREKQTHVQSATNRGGRPIVPARIFLLKGERYYRPYFISANFLLTSKDTFACTSAGTSFLGPTMLSLRAECGAQIFY